MTSKMVNFVVGGVYHSMRREDICRYPDSYFARATKQEWSNRPEAPVVINRNGEIFQFVLHYIHMDLLQIPSRLNDDRLALLVAIRAEADYYNLPGLVTSCEQSIEIELPKLCAILPSLGLFDYFQCQWKGGHDANDLDVYVRNFFPTVITGDLSNKGITGNIFMSSDIGNINTDEVINFYDVRKLSDESYALSSCYLEGLDTVEEIQKCLPSIPNIRSTVGTPVLTVILQRDQRYLPSAGPRTIADIGSVFYILQAATSGGVLSVTQNGITQTISQPGEYMVCGCDSDRTVSPIVSGELVYIRFKMKHRRDAWYVPSNNRGCEDVPADLASELITSAHTELTGSGTGCVVLCLSKLYLPCVFDSKTLQVETDCAALEGRDALLYAALEPHFHVALVTVYVQRYNTEIVGCVIGPAPEGSAKVKIITPPSGFGEVWEVKVEGETKFATLFTGLKLQAKL